MNILKEGTIIKTESGHQIRIIRFITFSDGAYIYSVDFCGEEKILKWFPSSTDFKNIDLLCKINRDICLGSEYDSIMWPLCLTEVTDDSFWYLVDKVPKDYYELSEFLNKPIIIPSYKQIVQICINILRVFSNLHNKGLFYGYISLSSIYINPNTCDVLVQYNENLDCHKISFPICCDPRFLAPEIITKKASFSINTDMYSISLILFILLFQNHPLEGKCSINIYLTPQLTEKLYGNEPLFIYDPFNDSNRPVEKLHQSVIDLWQTVPNYINDIFLKAFSQESLMNTVKRPVDSDWINVLVRLNSELMKCECGNELFISQQSTCDNCGKKITIDNYFKINQYRIPITKDMTLYKCQLGMYDTVNALKPIGAIIEKLDKTQMLGLKNLTNSVITATTPSGKHKSVQPNEIVPIKEGIDFEIFEERIVIV